MSEEISGHVQRICNVLLVQNLVERSCSHKRGNEIIICKNLIIYQQFFKYKKTLQIFLWMEFSVHLIDKFKSIKGSV